jgi:uncharacterized caspase-like protein
VQLPARDSTVEIVAENLHGRSTPLPIALKWDSAAGVAPGAPGKNKTKPRLIVLAVGITDYGSPNLKLRYASRDATGLVALLKKQQGRQYSEVRTKLVMDTQATAAGVQDGLQWLASQTSAGGDVGVIFLAGHGLRSADGEYHFAAADFDPQRPRETGLGEEALKNAMFNFIASGNRAVLLIDTCYAGGAIDSRLTASSGGTLAATLTGKEFGVVVLSASKNDEPAYESSDWQDGAFTTALLEGIGQSKADPGKTGQITVLDLGSYVSKRVRSLTQERQTPLLSTPSGGIEDFVVAVTN